MSKIRFIPVIPDGSIWKINVEHLTLQEIFEKYGHVLSDKEKLDLVREIQKSWTKDDDYLKRMTDEVDKNIEDQILELLNITR